MKQEGTEHHLLYVNPKDIFNDQDKPIYRYLLVAQARARADILSAPKARLSSRRPHGAFACLVYKQELGSLGLKLR